MLGAVVVAGAGIGAAAWLDIGDSGGRGRAVAGAATAEHRATGQTQPQAVAPRALRLVPVRRGLLPRAVQDAAIAVADATHVLLLGGLNAADSSTDTVFIAGAAGGRRLGRLPNALHDSAATRLGSSIYLFGGGTASSQLDQIVRVDAAGRAFVAGRLPAPSSDQAAAVIGGTAYVVGGFTGTRWLDSIVAWRPGTQPRVVARLPSPLRYAAVTAVAHRLVIAGGSLPSGAASDSVFVFTPGSGRVRRIARLPAPTTHAAAASLGGVAYVIGGRGAVRNTPTARIVSVDLSSGRVRNAGVLPTPTSDLAAATLSGKILVAGGRTREGTTGTLFLLLPKAVSHAGQPSPRALNARTAVVNVYAFDRANMLSRPARSAAQRIYVPNSRSGTVDEIDPRTYRVVRHFGVGALPQHVVPGYDLKTLYVTNDLGNSLTPIDPRTGKPGPPIPVDDPYNMYFTPDGRYAIVVAERLHRLDFRNVSSFRLHRSLPVPCTGVDHLDFSADNRYLIASCEFSGRLLKIDVRRERVVAVLDLPDGRGGMPQDVKLSPDGRVFYVADLRANGLWEIDGNRFRVIGFLRTGIGVHGLYPSRDARFLYATNRGEGSISVISFRTRRVVTTWRIPGGGSPDMGGVSADGKVLWVSGRYSGVVYAISTRTGKLLARIPVGSGPHGLCVWPQPGRYSLGHTGELR
jgi:DNA-binding beta-propeller fold protein YncE